MKTKDHEKILKEVLEWAKQEKGAYGYYPTDKEELKDYPTKDNQIKKAIALTEQAERKKILELIENKIKFHKSINTHISNNVIRELKSIKKEVGE